jgi:hypothetical protein
MDTTTEDPGKDREKELLAQAKSANRKNLKATKNSTESTHAFGLILVALQQETGNEEKGKWFKYLRDNLPDVDGKRAQRAMKLARQIDLETCPGLAFLSQNKLLKLASLTKGDSLADTLNENGIDCDVSLKDGGKLKGFKGEIDGLIKTLTKEKAKAKDPLESFFNSVTNLEESFHAITENEALPPEVDILKLKEVGQTLTTILRELQGLIDVPRLECVSGNQ